MARSSSARVSVNSSAVTGLASTNRPTAQGMEMIMIVFTDSPIFSLVPSRSPAAVSWATVGIMAAAMAVAKVMGILEIVTACPEKMPHLASSAISSTSRSAGRIIRYTLLLTVLLRL